jgi:hypothetical protein
MPEIIITIIMAIVGVAGAIAAYYMHIKKKIENTALDAINTAEDMDAVGAEKFKEAVDIVVGAIPVVAKPFIPRSVVEVIVQKVFDKVAEFAKKQVTENKEKVDE